MTAVFAPRLQASAADKPHAIGEILGDGLLCRNWRTRHDSNV
jgi:hypothetical protein